MRARLSNEVDCSHLGRRVSIRRSLAEGGTSDTVGVLEACDESSFWVRDKRSALVRIPRERVVASRVVPG